MLDCHIIVPSFTDPQLLSECIKSVAVAQDRAQDRVALYLVEGQLGTMWRQRQRGFSYGNAPYVCMIDDDDVVHPDIFVKVLEVIDSEQPDVIYTGEQIEYPDGSIKVVNKEHHMLTAKRSIVEQFDFAKANDNSTLDLRLWLKQYRTAYVPDILYTYRWRNRVRSLGVKRYGT